MQRKNYDVQKCQQIEITLVCIPIQTFICMHISVILFTNFNRIVFILARYNDDTCIGLQKIMFVHKHDYTEFALKYPYSLGCHIPFPP